MAFSTPNHPGDLPASPPQTFSNTCINNNHFVRFILSMNPDHLPFPLSSPSTPASRKLTNTCLLRCPHTLYCPLGKIHWKVLLRRLRVFKSPCPDEKYCTCLITFLAIPQSNFVNALCSFLWLFSVYQTHHL